MGNPSLAFQTDFPVQGRPHSFAMPAIYRWGDLGTEGQEGGRYTAATTAGESYVLGGTHLTNPSFLPNALLKEMTGTEYNANTSHGFFNKNHKLSDLDEQQEYIHSLANRPQWLARTDPASSVEDVPTVLPWWLGCNPDRFPYWHGRREPRNEALLWAMEQGGQSAFSVGQMLKQYEK